MTTLDIFDVGHGQCALLTCEDGSRMLIDCAHSTGTDRWSPASHLVSLGVRSLGMLVITNYDEDHARGLVDLRRHVHVEQLLRNRSVSADTLRTLKSDDGMGAGIDELARMIGEYNLDVPEKHFPNVEFETFALRYPDFDDENNLSLVLFLKVHGVGILFPGDLETKGWASLLASNERLRQIAPSISVLVASHHGRENGKSQTLFEDHGCNPFWIVISDKGYEYETQQTLAWYRSRAKGAEFEGSFRTILTTRTDGHIRFKFDGVGWSAAKLS